MTSMQSDTESNISAFTRYKEQDLKHYYIQIIEKMRVINQDILEIENNMKNIIQHAGPLESKLTKLLHVLPKPNLSLPMEME